MRSIARSLSDTPLILKGGTALLLAYGLNRFSEDLDFDSNKHLRLENRIEKASGPLVKVESVDVPKNTETVQRYRVKYSMKAMSGVLKIEVSCRDSLMTLPKPIFMTESGFMTFLFSSTTN